MKIKYFDHDHLLLLISDVKRYISDVKRYDRIRCRACTKMCDGEAYICSRKYCSYALHESCEKLPRQVQSPFHPHPLTLGPNLKTYSNCYVCKMSCGGFLFRCDKEECDIELDLECAFIRRVNKEVEEGEEGHTHSHFNHPHPFELVENMPNHRVRCPVCASRTYCPDPDSTYGCFSCGLFIHRSCFERDLPPQIIHFHHPHPLTLRTNKSNKIIYCKACCQSWNQRLWYYCCKQCDSFEMDIDCTLLPTTIDIRSESHHEFEQIQHFLHAHPLSLSKNKDAKKVVDCGICGKGCSADTPTYVCGKRSSCEDICFHESCLVWPQQICHPFHPYHPLTPTLLDQKDPERRCNACRKPIHPIAPRTCKIAYICHDCDFLLHPECSVMMPSITYEGHGHLLQFRDNIENINTGNELKCSVCKYDICESYAFICLYCDLNLHLECGPLPYIIKHKCHMDPLILTNSPLREEFDEEEDDTYEFYCDACEEERDLLLPIYHCADCHFVAEIKCVMSKIKLLLKGEYGDVELRSTLGHSGKLICQNTTKIMRKKERVKTTLTVYDILKSWSKDETEQLNSILRAGREEIVITKEDDHDHKDSVSEAFLFSDEAYTQFMKVLDRGAKISTPFKCGGEVHEVSSDSFPKEEVVEVNFDWDLKEEVVSVEDYMVTLRLSPILKHLLCKHGDISSMSTLSPKVKMYLFHMLCECIYSMIITKVVDITKNLLLKWWTCLMTLQFAEFDIQFAFDHLKRVAHAYLGLHVRNEGYNALNKMDSDIQELEDKCKALKDKRKYVKAAESAKSSLIKECLREASILRHGKAGGAFCML